MQAVATPEVYVYIRTVMSMVIGLSLARLLTGLGGIVQSPGKFRVYWVHLGWVASMFLFIIHFWWWEYRLQSLAVISFGVYLFLISFCCLFFFLCVLIVPNDDRGLRRLRGIFHLPAKMVFRHAGRDLCG
ncbi:hypothetical protein GCM10010520_62670 [Rhizobium viscosum]